LAMQGGIMKIGDLVDDGLGNIGIIQDWGWIFSPHKEQAYYVHFADTFLNGWYEQKDLEVL
jgi:hypothetical protein